MGRNKLLLKGEIYSKVFFCVTELGTNASICEQKGSALKWNIYSRPIKLLNLRHSLRFSSRKLNVGWCSVVRTAVSKLKLIRNFPNTSRSIERFNPLDELFRKMISNVTETLINFKTKARWIFNKLAPCLWLIYRSKLFLGWEHLNWLGESFVSQSV